MYGYSYLLSIFIYPRVKNMAGGGKRGREPFGSRGDRDQERGKDEKRSRGSDKSDRDREHDRYLERDSRDRERDVRDRERDSREKERSGRDRDREGDPKDRDRGGRDRERDGRDRDRDGRDRERDGRDRERDGRDRERDGRDNREERDRSDKSGKNERDSKGRDGSGRDRDGRRQDDARDDRRHDDFGRDSRSSTSKTQTVHSEKTSATSAMTISGTSPSSDFTSKDFGPEPTYRLLTEAEFQAFIELAQKEKVDVPIPRSVATVSQDPALIVSRDLAGEDLFESVVRDRHANVKVAGSEYPTQSDVAQLHSAKKDKEKAKDKLKREKERESLTTLPTPPASVLKVEPQSAPKQEVAYAPDEDLYGDLGGGAMDEDLYGDLDDGGADITAESANTEDQDMSIVHTAQAPETDNQPTSFQQPDTVQRTLAGLVADEITGAYPLPQSVSVYYGQNTSTARYKLVNSSLQGTAFSTRFSVLDSFVRSKAIPG